MKRILGKKIGMTQIFKEDGTQSAVTVIDVSNNVISKLLTDGDNITHIELGFSSKVKNTRKSDEGNYKELGFVPKYKVAFKKDEGVEGEIKVGDEIKPEIFVVGDIVDVTAKTKGKGFQGVMKRWGFKGGKRTHGQSDRDRAPGSIGSGTTPGRVYKGKKMAGRMGAVQRTIKKLRIEDVDVDNGLIAVSGSIPGANGTYVIIKESF
ncbi:MAG: 50S ribosomal protein L3 [Candidatus Dojkabacteria bacterium]|nr:50S ribosomal protein L3 [Candidatus Dojkabacteria bacterium]